ncbi:Plant invertase/pectin methylesterase inhibitor superfamily protein [Hirschfeldia incana]|nr:Plant invertase/pectin methylesterase inhibitor superfamily protein [Hirschfeldia incana]
MFSVLPLLVLLSVTPLSSSYTPSDKVTKEVVVQLCSKPSLSKHFCIAWLISDPKTLTLDLHGLLGLVIAKTEGFGVRTTKFTKGLVNTTTDPNLKMIYGSCLTSYEMSTKGIEVAKVYASSKVYFSANMAAYKAFNAIADCETLIEAQPIPAYFSRRVEVFERMCIIGMVFSKAKKFKIVAVVDACNLAGLRRALTGELVFLKKSKICLLRIQYWKIPTTNGRSWCTAALACLVFYEKGIMCAAETLPSAYSIAKLAHWIQNLLEASMEVSK